MTLSIRRSISCNSKTYLSLTVLLAALLAPPAHAVVNLGELGKTYDIVEPDILQEMQERAAKIDMQKYFEQEKVRDKVKNYRPKDMRTIPRAPEDRVFYVDMTAELEMDIPDPANPGDILYPKGYKINPLEYINLDDIYVLINANDKRQVEWFKKSKYYKNINTVTMLTDGSYIDASQDFRRPVYYADGLIIDKFAIERVPSIVVQEGTLLKVTEVDIDGTVKKPQKRRK